jgi:pyruvate dehydrogenase E2 component (dihydrolipoamide acetyltransferase)
MKLEMIMPDLSTAGSTVKIIRWLAAQGESIRRGQPLLEVETDKAAMEVEAAGSGVLSAILASDGSEVEVGSVIAVLDTPEGEPAPAQPAAGGSPGLETPGGAPLAAAPAAQPAAPKPGGMFARNRQKAAAAAPQEPAPHTAPLHTAMPVSPAGSSWSANQQLVAHRMQASKTTIPHFYLQMSANAGAMSARRGRATGEKTAWDAFFVFAAARALQKYPRMCASIVDGALVPSTVEAVGVAVDLEGDLYVISIPGPAEQSPEAISAEIRTRVQRLKEGDPEARRLRSNQLTITNLGATGVEAFTAIINPPEAAVLAAGRVAPAVVALDGQVAIQERVTLTLSVDHRVANGRYAAEFLAEIVRELENL